MAAAQLIVSSRYIKSGTKNVKTKRTNFTKYIATRESVEKRPQGNSPVTQNQTQLINELINEFPIAKTYLEYEDYNSSPTEANASDLISTIIERHADVIGNRKNFVGYMANRPGAERRGEHGLFNDSDDPIDLDAVANEIANHPGNVWTHVVSLRREDAVRLGYTNSDMWRELVRRHIADIATAQNIPIGNLKWYAAFHNTTHHPHIHLLVYSTNPNIGYLTKEGIDKIRSKFANDIFQDELKTIYQEQTLRRDELRALSENLMKEIMAEIGNGHYDTNLENLIMELSDQVRSVRGKKVYGYLPKEVKKTVNDIFLLLAQNESIKKLYDKWCELESIKYKTYTLQPPKLPPLIDNKEFRSVKNMIIKTVLNMNDPLNDTIDAPLPEPDYYKGLASLVNNKYGLLKYGKQILSGDNMPQSTELGLDLLNKAVDAGNMNAKRYIALEYISGKHLSQDIEKGLEMLTDMANSGDGMSSYSLGKIYLTGEIVYKDLEKAESYLLDAASCGIKYADYALAKLYIDEERYDPDLAVEYLEKAYLYDEVRPWAAYTYAKFLLGNNEYHDSQKAIRLLEENSDNNMCSYLLGKLYSYGTKEIPKDQTKADQYLKQSAESGNEYAMAMLQKSNEPSMPLTIFSLLVRLSRIIEDNYVRLQHSVQPKVDKKLRRIIQQKKKDLGIKQEGYTMQQY